MVENQVQPRTGAFNGGMHFSAALPAQIKLSDSAALPSALAGMRTDGGAGPCLSLAPDLRAALRGLHEALRSAIDSARDLCGMPNATDPAVDAWIVAAEAARGTVQRAAGTILDSFDGRAPQECAARTLAALTLDLLRADTALGLQMLRGDLLALEQTARFTATGSDETWRALAEAAAQLRVYVDLDPPVVDDPWDGWNAAAF